MPRIAQILSQLEYRDRTLSIEPAVIESLVSLKSEFSNISYEVK